MGLEKLRFISKFTFLKLRGKFNPVNYTHKVYISSVNKSATLGTLNKTISFISVVF